MCRSGQRGGRKPRRGTGVGGEPAASNLVRALWELTVAQVVTACSSREVDGEILNIC